MTRRKCLCWVSSTRKEEEKIVVKKNRNKKRMIRKDWSYAQETALKYERCNRGKKATVPDPIYPIFFSSPVFYDSSEQSHAGRKLFLICILMENSHDVPLMECTKKMKINFSYDQHYYHYHWYHHHHRHHYHQLLYYLLLWITHCIKIIV